MSGPAVGRGSRVDVALAVDMRADAAAVAVLRRLLEVITDHLDEAIAGVGEEPLHQLRVAVRRTRTVQRQLAGVFDAALPGFRSEFRWLQQATGEARDLDVHVAELEALATLLPADLRADLRPIRPVLLHARLTARAAMGRALASSRAEWLLADWEQLLESLVEGSTDERPDACRPIGELVGQRIERLYGQIVKRGRRLGPDSPAADFHELRKRGKELRYLLELFGLPLFGADRVAELVRALRGVQDVLGRHQDREVQRALLIEIADEVGGLPGGGSACLAMGVLVDRLAQDEQAARADFARRLRALSHGDARRAIRRLSAH